MNELASCILVTRNRRILTRQAVAYFLRQTYSERELVIVDASEIPAPVVSPLVTYLTVPPDTTIGTARNIAVERARGDAIVCWDSDDWYAPDYLGAMVAFLSFSDMAALIGFRTYDFLLRRAWMRGPAIGGCAFGFSRSIWSSHAFPDSSRGEDTAFWRHHKAQGKLLVELERPELFIYMRHPNQGSYAIGEPVRDNAMTADVRRQLGDDLDFYDELSELVEPPPIAARNGPAVLAGGFGPAFWLPQTHPSLPRQR